MINFDCLFDLLNNIGCKISLDTIRRKTLNKHQDFLQIFPEDFYNKTPANKNYRRTSTYWWILKFNDLSDTVLSSRWKLLQCTHHFALWHDGSTLSNHSHLLIWSMFCMIMLSSTHLKSINNKQENSFKIVLRQLNSGEHTPVLLPFIVAPHLPFSLTNPPFYHLIPPTTQIPESHILEEYWRCVSYLVLTSILALFFEWFKEK